MAGGDFHDTAEARAPEARERDLFARLPGQIAHAKAHARHFASSLADVDPASVTDRAALAAVPLLRKSDVVALQRADPPFGGLVADAGEAVRRIFVSPGPIYEPQGTGDDYWRLARALHAAGLRAGQLVLNAFAYHLTPAGMMLESGASALGCAVIPAGGGNTEQQVAVIADLRPDAYVGVPDFLKILLDKADETGADVSSLRHALVSGAALPGSLRAELQGRGVSVLQCYATADVGLIAYETMHDGAPVEGMVVDEEIIVEIVRPGTGDPVQAGEVGEVVLTVFNPLHPLIRFATGDLSAVLSAPSPCGRTNMRLRGWMGRADQTTKVRGMFVRPEQVADVAGRHPEILRARLVVSRADERDAMTLRCEIAAGADAGLADAIAQSLSDATKLRGAVELVSPGSLPNDGKVIDDTRPVE
jgi:phenylacetate-CoA ligase